MEYQMLIVFLDWAAMIIVGTVVVAIALTVTIWVIQWAKEEPGDAALFLLLFLLLASGGYLVLRFVEPVYIKE